MNNFPTYNASIIVTTNLESELGKILSRYPEDKLFLVTEETCDRLCVPLIASTPGFSKFKKVVIPSGESNKKLASVEKIWLFLSQNGADRKSLVVNLGGGMLTDLGSFAASTIKRGMDFVNIPTTLLAQVDASVGGKTGFNFNGLKNEIGVINQPISVIIDTRFLHSIDQPNFISGYAEMIKHGLINSVDHLQEVQNFDPKNPNFETLIGIIARSVAIKDEFVFQDPNERNVRKALNFGHTIGHAFESYAMEIDQPILHGYAVAYGMLAELYLSHKVCNLPLEVVNELSTWLLALYGKYTIEESRYEALFQLMTHDKKNEGSRINFTLIPAAGEMAINQNCDKKLVFEALEYFRNLNR
ncbi:MAG: 3-dehydroquinate synthase [Bacteroidia bacterium]|nr:3-dehydroquinate synthase [Bacteroidia bacterium]